MALLSASLTSVACPSSIAASSVHAGSQGSSVLRPQPLACGIKSSLLMSPPSCSSSSSPSSLAVNCRLSSQLLPSSSFVSLALSRKCTSTSAAESQSRARVICSMAVQAKVPITLHMGDASLTVPFSVETAKQLEAAVAKLLDTFRQKEQASRPQRWENMEFRYTGDVAEGDVCLEVFCNPNACSSPFQAKVMITMRDDRVKFTSEAQLSDLQSDIGAYLEANA